MMNDVIAEQWPRIRSALQRRWGRLTDEDLARDGSAGYLAGLIEQRYGMIREVADRQVRDFARRVEKRLQSQSHGRPQPVSSRQPPPSPDQRRPV
ncbi:MAG TPA: hypothetical protein VEZ88_07345 [Steroidobacteraceae bacterium]|nr:hypothetical protein [Steroidobacteraceae bacterium]